LSVSGLSPCRVLAAQCEVSASFCLSPSQTTELSTLSLHDALPILPPLQQGFQPIPGDGIDGGLPQLGEEDEPQGGAVAFLVQSGDRKSTRLNSSHVSISYAVFCLKKKNKKQLLTDTSAIDGYPPGK